MVNRAYRVYGWFTLAFTIGVILWGAYVRASGSGAGCGDHWPLCDGEVIPRAPDVAKAIEFTHRLTSGLSLIFVVALYFWTNWISPPGSFQRRAARLSFYAIILEALVGAMLVLLQLVGGNSSPLRALVIALHLLNTLFLLAAIAVTVLTSYETTPRWRWTDPKQRLWARSLLLGFSLLGAFGALAALGDTLFPVSSLSESWNRDRQRHFLEEIRILHPLIAVAWSGALWWWLSHLWERLPELKARSILLLVLTAGNLALGLLNVLLLAPIWIQIVHLLWADVLWILFISLLFSGASRWR